MRIPVAAAMFVVLAAGTFSPPAALAQSDVLLPSDSGGAPNLGLMPGGSSSQNSNSTPAQNYTPIPNTSSATAPPPASAPPAVTPSTAATPPTMSPSAMGTSNKTQVMQLPMNKTSMFMGKGDTPNSLLITVDNRLSSTDVTRVSGILGIPEKQVPAQCSLSVNGMIQTDSGPGTFDSGDDIQLTMKYSGQLKSIMAATRVMCTISGDLPPNKGMIMQMGDKYVVQLGGAGCQVPAHMTPTKVVVGAGPTIAGKCEFH